MKNILILACLFCSTALLAQEKNCDSILWTKDKKLSWDDFKAIPDTSSKDTAQSLIRLQKKWKLRGDTLTIIVSGYFVPCFAWTKSKKSDTLLIHEQGHFDISEYFRRLSNKRFSEQHLKRQNLKNDIEAINRDIEMQQKYFVALYEAKTNHGSIRPMQEEWTNKILSLIDSVKEFDQPKITKIIAE